MGTASSSARVSDQVRRKRREVEEQRTKIVARTRYIEWWKKQGLVTDDKDASPVLSYIVSRLKNLQCPIPEDLFLDAYILDKNLIQTTLLELTTKVFTSPINKEHYENFTVFHQTFFLFLFGQAIRILFFNLNSHQKFASIGTYITLSNLVRKGDPSNSNKIQAKKNEVFVSLLVRDLQNSVRARIKGSVGAVSQVEGNRRL
ncbi:hypothetical protein RFI_07697 [Reticulomyxa filosa]|uniref:Uncharacterized protein n=1 Tax=Reticulomyxa filosa TaxID=46433 RepID=X6NVY5_RETFI|nr:hypothetical protein RFI_07697 [Reticulomyxa filosa]|eukprot:ETO29422.1 hypothetical protein RFI_07697 [Reticulomyxa filosa]